MKIFELFPRPWRVDPTAFNTILAANDEVAVELRDIYRYDCLQDVAEAIMRSVNDYK